MLAALVDQAASLLGELGITEITDPLVSRAHWRMNADTAHLLTAVADDHAGSAVRVSNVPNSGETLTLYGIRVLYVKNNNPFVLTLTIDV